MDDLGCWVLFPSSTVTSCKWIWWQQWMDSRISALFAFLHWKSVCYAQCRRTSVNYFNFLFWTQFMSLYKIISLEFYVFKRTNIVRLRNDIHFFLGFNLKFMIPPIAGLGTSTQTITVDDKVKICTCNFWSTRLFKINWSIILGLTFMESLQ